ncbi:hypothetical protein PVAND_007677 [Polypedilum vanderplanki]|uniref:ZAD domain-containing protein n=1 Tax=Polypedilum vanderplanki TaxID=319348 RepID=A0A9J6C7P0_POLVA|nr:hypothetical protein PVAND_007677 [Polypedilum vanderplanki]
MRDIHKLCKICLNPGSRDIFESNILGNIVSRDELNRIAEKLRFVTLLKVSPKENLPQQICDLCIVQLNVSYNFKRLALKNDFYIRQYMIENGMNLTKEDEENNVSTQLEIHQIHNVIRTSNCYRPQTAITSVTEMRRNSTTSSVSGVSAMLVNSSDTNGSTTNGNNNEKNFAHPTRPFVRPIQIKTEPIDDGYEDATNTNSTNINGTQSSPSASSNGSESILTVASSEKSMRTRPKTPPMIVINGHISNEEKTPKTAMKTKQSEPSTTSPKRVRIMEKQKEPEKPRDAIRNLRIIKKPTDQAQVKRKVREAAKKMIEQKKKTQKDMKPKKLQKEKTKTVQKKEKKNVLSKKQSQKPRKPQYKQQQPKKSFKAHIGDENCKKEVRKM